MHRIIGLALASTLLSGCALVNGARIDSAGVPVKSEDGFQSVDLPLALNPYNKRSPSDDVEACIEKNGKNCVRLGSLKGSGSFGVFSSNIDTSDADEDADEVVERLRLETAYWHFYNAPELSGQRAEDRRNRVQQRLIGASDMNCGIFTQRIYGIQATGNFALGSLATAVGGAGAIVTDVNSARLLSGLSAITSGIRAEMNEDFFRKQWIEALVKAIGNERSRLRDEIATKSTKSITDYPVEAAVADAIRYNDACSLVEGLKEVNRAVTIADDPAGLRAFRESYARAGFDATFTATVTSDGPVKSDRLRAASSATASVALTEIAGDVAETRALVAETIARIKGLSPPVDDLDKAEAEIKTAIDSLYLPDKSEYGKRLKDLVNALNEYANVHATLRDELAAATDPEIRRQKEDLMVANDAAAERVRRSARDAVTASRGEILAAADTRAAKQKAKQQAAQ